MSTRPSYVLRVTNAKTSKPTPRDTIAIGLLEKTERRSHWAISFPNIATYGKR